MLKYSKSPSHVESFPASRIFLISWLCSSKLRSVPPKAPLGSNSSPVAWREWNAWRIWIPKKSRYLRLRYSDDIFWWYFDIFWWYFDILMIFCWYFDDILTYCDDTLMIVSPSSTFLGLVRLQLLDMIRPAKVDNRTRKPRPSCGRPAAMLCKYRKALA